MMDIKGYYKFKIPITTMFLNKVLEINGTNLITFKGEVFFINRCINNEFKPLRSICVGNSDSAPSKSNSQLNHETARRVAVVKQDFDNNSVLLTASFTSEEIIGVNEIGVTAVNPNGDDFLVSHDVFHEIDGEFLTNLYGTVEVEYRFQFISSNLIDSEKWIKQENYYYVYQPNPVANVYTSTGNGFHKVSSKNNVNGKLGSYYYDTVNQNLYIRLHDNSTNIMDVDIIVQLKGGLYNFV